jgi:hypothetical protein
MGTLVQAQELLPSRTDLRLFINRGPESGAVLWRINGFRARLLVWTAEEWEQLEAHPIDAQYHPSGVWCALRLD